MKSNVKNTLLSILLVSLVFSCKKEEDVKETTVTNEDAADLVASSLGTGTYGYNSSVSEMAQKTTYANSQSEPCLYSLDTNIVKNFTGTLTTYNYNLNYSYQTYCTSGIPQNVVCNMTSSGNLEQARLSASSDASGILTISGLNPGATSYTANGTYSRTGSASSKVRSKNSFTYDLSLDLSNLSISKTDYTIEGGSSSVTIDATSSTGQVFHFTGSITYVDADTATLVLNGTTYTINIPTSDVN